MSLKKKGIVMDAVATTDTNVDYGISSPDGMDDVTLYLDIIGEGGFDGLISFYIIGLNETATPINALNMESFLNVVSVNSPGVLGVKLQATVTAWESFRMRITNRTTGTVTAYITEVVAE